MATRVQLDDHGPTALVVCGEDGVWSVLEGSYDPDFLERYLNLMWGPDWKAPPLKFEPYPSFLRVQELLKVHKGEIIFVDLPPIDPDATY